MEKSYKNIKFFFLLLIFLCYSSINIAQVKNEIYYFSVGSEHYERDQSKVENGFNGLLQVRGVVESAKRIKSLFDTIGAKGGELLVSEDYTFITKEKLFNGLKEAIRNAKKLKLRNPLFVFYYCGHGFTNGELQAMFIPPGDLTRNPKKFTYEEWLENTISPVEIREILEESGLRYMIILDCCYEGDLKEAETLNPKLVDLIGFEIMDDLMKESYKIIIVMNQMSGPDPVLFSAISGKSVPIVKYEFSDGIKKVGQLCRRMYKIFNEKLKDSGVTLSDFMVMMQYDDLDTETSPAISYWEMDESAWNYLK